MAVQHIGGMVFFHQPEKGFISPVNHILSIPDAPGRGMGYQHVEPSVFVELPGQFQDPQLHLVFAVHILAFLIGETAAETEETDAVVYENLSVNVDAAFRRQFGIMIVMIAVDIQQRNVGACHQEGQVAGIQVAAGDDQVRILQTV